METDDGRDNHFIAFASAETASRNPRGDGKLIHIVLAIGLTPQPFPSFPLLIDGDRALSLAGEFDHDDIVNVMQGVGDTPDGEEADAEFKPFWNVTRFDNLELLVDTAHLEPHANGRSVRLIVEAGTRVDKFLLSLQAAARLRQAIRAFLDYQDTIDELSGPHPMG